MTLQKILFSFNGRIGRRTYWLATLALIVAVQVVTFAPFLLPSEEWAVLIVALTSQFIWLFSLWPMLAVGSKRLHDRNKNGWWLLAFWLLPVALFVGGFSIVFFDDPRTGRTGDFSTGSVLILASLVPALWGRGRTRTAPTRLNNRPSAATLSYCRTFGSTTTISTCVVSTAVAMIAMCKAKSSSISAAHSSSRAAT